MNRDPPPASRAAEIVAALGMVPHPERGFFVESYRSPVLVQQAAGSQRAASTAIYFLVTAAAPATRLHRLRSDEIFHLYEGGPLEILRLFPDGGCDVAHLGRDLAAGQRPQIVVSAGTWFGVELAGGVELCLMGCTVAPGFDFADFELAEGPELAVTYPTMAARIGRMSRNRALP
jgi:uncharacterized protein